MNAVYIRIVVYVLSTVLGMIPAAWADFVAFNADTGTLVVQIEGLVIAVTGALAASSLVYRIWGDKPAVNKET